MKKNRFISDQKQAIRQEAPLTSDPSAVAKLLGVRARRVSAWGAAQRHVKGALRQRVHHSRTQLDGEAARRERRKKDKQIKQIKLTSSFDVMRWLKKSAVNVSRD